MRWLATALVCSLAALGCSGTSVGNPPGATTHVRLGITGSAPPKPMSIDVGSGIVLDEAWVAVREMKLADDGTCGDTGDTEYDAAGPVAAELVSSAVLPGAPEWERPAGQKYCGFRARVDKLDAAIAGAPAGLSGHTAFVTGHRSDGTAFRATIDFSEHVDLAAPGGAFALGEGQVGLVLAFELGSWFDPQALDAAPATGGVVVIDDQSNKDIADALKESIPASVHLFGDGNRNGRLDGDDASHDYGE